MHEPSVKEAQDLQDKWKKWQCMQTAVKSLQSCLTLYDPIDGSPPGSAIHGILQARIPEWVAISFSTANYQKNANQNQNVLLPHTIQSMEFSRPEYWSGQPFSSPPPEDLPNPGIEPRSPISQVDSLPAEPQGKPICKLREDVKLQHLSSGNWKFFSFTGRKEKPGENNAGLDC